MLSGSEFAILVFVYSSYQPFLEFPRKEKRPSIEVLNLKKLLLHIIMYGLFCMGGQRWILHWCAKLVLEVLFICISNVSVILGLLFFPVFMILMKKPNVVHIIYLSSINMQFTKLQVRPLQVNQNWHTHRLNYLQSHKMDFVV